MSIWDSVEYWTGASGQSYAHVIYPAHAALGIPGGGNYTLVHRDAAGKANALYHGESDDVGERSRDHCHDGLFEDASRRGFNEIHVHFLGSNKRERLRIETDMRQGNWTPLNKQPTNALRLGMFGSSAPRVRGNGLAGILEQAILNPTTPTPRDQRVNALAALLLADAIKR